MNGLDMLKGLMLSLYQIRREEMKGVEERSIGLITTILHKRKYHSDGDQTVSGLSFFFAPN
jgi:hypothetical protein